MNTQFVLLLTRDRDFEGAVRKALPQATILVQRHIGGALEILCACHQNLALVIVDFDHGCHGMTLLGAIKMVDDHLPVVGMTSKDAYHAAAVAYANGAAACVVKPITAAELRLVIEELGDAKPELMVA